MAGCWQVWLHCRECIPDQIMPFMVPGAVPRRWLGRASPYSPWGHGSCKKQYGPMSESGGHHACSGIGTRQEPLKIGVYTEGMETTKQQLHEWVWGRNVSLCMPGQTYVVLSPHCSQLCSGPQHFAVYVRAPQQELIALSVLSASRIAVCVLVMLIWLACFWVGWGATGKRQEQVKKKKNR